MPILTSNSCHPELIRQMRLMLCEGCTPLHIIRSLCAHHGGEGRWQAFVADCFQHAFSVTLTALPDRSDSLLTNRKLQDYLNTELLHDIIARRDEWLSPGDDTWLSDLNATDIWTATDSFDPQAIPEIAQLWSQLDDPARQYLRLILVNSRANHERSLILARLAEHLQREVARSSAGHASVPTPA